ncbi:hypothetical protein [Liquorilactobacillus mali]|uniref:hypothetical protein n=1 Tax=Liquorilactobacillus mali TaxID=1618 RepID=UPI00295561F2|nr:hypothetical protein [Liquorilactobacillus mali]MDV7756859.1 hypothetical protein [Liquorilactobacillus mali]
MISNSDTTNVVKVTKSTTTVSSDLAVDGKMEYKAILFSQKLYNMEYQDGILSKPTSSMIRIWQKHLGVKQDGKLGPITIAFDQCTLGTPVDRKISSGYSLFVAAM